MFTAVIFGGHPAGLCVSRELNLFRWRIESVSMPGVRAATPRSGWYPRPDTALTAEDIPSRSLTSWKHVEPMQADVYHGSSKEDQITPNQKVDHDQFSTLPTPYRPVRHDPQSDVGLTYVPVLL